MSTVKLPAMKDFIGWNLRLFYPTFDIHSPSGKLLFVNPCTRLEYDNRPPSLTEQDRLVPGVELFKRMDVAMMVSVISHVSRPLCTAADILKAGEGPDAEDWRIALAHLNGEGANRIEAIYDLLATLPSPLHRDTQAMIRGILRAACTVRSGLQEGKLSRCIEVLLAVGIGMGIVKKNEVY